VEHVLQTERFCVARREMIVRAMLYAAGWMAGEKVRPHT
jgi:hypothetical protein